MTSKHAQQRHSSTQMPLTRLLKEAEQPYNSKSRYVLYREDIGVRIARQYDDGTAVVNLLSRMYGQRGYRIPNPSPEARDGVRQITLEACHRDTTVGTITVALDGLGGLKAEELYGWEIGSFRSRNARLCEFTRLAVDTGNNAKQTLAYLFHLAFIFAYRIHDATDLFIEVNPRHALFYRRKLGFVQVGEEKNCPRVNAPAVLLHRSLSAVAEEVRRFGGIRTPENNTFYALWLPHEEENDMVRKIEERLAHGRVSSYPLYSREEPTASLARSA